MKFQHLVYKKIAEIFMFHQCLFYVAEKGYGILARVLLESGASIDIVDKNGWQVGETAVDKGHYKVCKKSLKNKVPKNKYLNLFFNCS